MIFIVIDYKYPSAISACKHTRLMALQYIYWAALYCRPRPYFSSSTDPWRTIRVSAHQARPRMHLAHLVRPRMELAHLVHSRTGLLVLCRPLRHYSRHQILRLGVKSSQAQ
jgi:hypothetical protein